MSLLIETKNAIREVALPTLYQRTKVESLFTKMINDQEEKNGLLTTENAQLQQRKIALDVHVDQTVLDELEKEISQLQNKLEERRIQELSLNEAIVQKQKTYTRRVSALEQTLALDSYFRT